MSMKQVRAIERGFYDGIREIGDVFHIPDDFDMPWVVVVDDSKPEKKGKKKPDEGQDKPEDEQAPA